MSVYVPTIELESTEGTVGIRRGGSPFPLPLTMKSIPLLLPPRWGSCLVWVLRKQSLRQGFFGMWISEGVLSGGMQDKAMKSLSKDIVLGDSRWSHSELLEVNCTTAALPKGWGLGFYNPSKNDSLAMTDSQGWGEVEGMITHHLWYGSISQGKTVSGEGGNCEPLVTNTHSSWGWANLIKGWGHQVDLLYQATSNLCPRRNATAKWLTSWPKMCLHIQ